MGQMNCEPPGPTSNAVDRLQIDREEKLFFSVTSAITEFAAWVNADCLFLTNSFPNGERSLRFVAWENDTTRPVFGRKVGTRASESQCGEETSGYSS